MPEKEAAVAGKAFKETFGAIDLSSITTLYQTDAIISNLRLLKPKGYLGAIKTLQTKGPFLSEKELTQFGTLQATMKRSLTPLVSSMEVFAKNGFRPSVAKEIKTILEAKGASELGAVFNPKLADQPGYAFKLGNENHREILAGKMAKMMEIDHLLTPKLEQTFKKGELGTVAQPSGIASKWLAEGKDVKRGPFWNCLKAKQELEKERFALVKERRNVDAWIDNQLKSLSSGNRGKATSELQSYIESRLNIMQEDLLLGKKSRVLKKQIGKAGEGKEKGKLLSEKKLISARREVLQERAEKLQSDVGSKMPKGLNIDFDELDIELDSLTEQVAAVESEKAEANEALEELLHDPETPSLKSVQGQALLDLLFMAYDSHINQYKVVDGELECFDFARFLTPGVAFKRTTTDPGDGSQKVDTFLALKSTFLDHPLCDQKIPQSLVDKVLSYDMSKIQNEMTKAGILEGEKFFQERGKGLKEIGKKLNQVLPKARPSQEALKKLCSEHKIPFSGKPAIDKQNLQLTLKKEQAKIKQQAFSRVHPKAFKAMGDRIGRMQAYLKSEKEPTMSALFSQAEPEVALLCRLGRRIDSTPTLSLALSQTGPVALEDIAEKLKDYTTEDEQKQLQNAIAKLRKTACTADEVSLSCDLWARG